MKKMPVSLDFGFKVFLLVLVLVSFSACQTNRPHPYRCTLPSGYNVSDAFSHANAELSHLECHNQFDQYLDRLLDVSASDPKQENRQQFSDFFGQARDNGVISQLQARDYYQRYFTPNFVALGRKHNNCSTTCRHESENIKALKMELRDKQRGLLEVSADQPAFTQADREFNQLLTLIEATCLACRSSE